jgi:hypothetical protein
MGRDLGIADRLRAAGLNVVEVAGWQTRGSDSFNPRGSVDHHTAGPRNGNAPSLNICVNGRTGLPGPLCNVLVGRDNTCYVVAAGKANHAGLGGWRGLVGNSSVFGVERENVGTGAEPWRPDQTETAAKVHAALISVHGANPELVCEHKEWAPRRKIDAYGVDGDQMRSMVRVFLGKPNPTPPPAPPKPNTNDFLKAISEAAKKKPTLKRGMKGNAVKDLQSNINAIVKKNVLVVDGDFGASTERWVKQFQKDRGLTADGVVGYNTWVQILASRF